MKDAASGLRRLAYAGALTALAVGICYLEQIPWFELQSLVVFAAGYLLGARFGAVVGGLAMAVYSLANPYGVAHPVVFASQVIGRALVGATGGWAASLGLPRAGVTRICLLVAWAVAGSLVFDVLTNLATGIVFGQLVPSLVLGAPWALAHLLTNAAVYAMVGGPLASALEPRRRALVACVAAALVALGTTPTPVRAQDSTATAPLDTTLRIVPDTSGATPPPAAAPEPAPIRRSAALARWGWGLTAQERLRRTPTGADDAWAAVGAAPRLYEDRADTEPLVFAGFPSALCIGAGDGSAIGPRSTVWQEAGWLASGGRASMGWSAIATAGEDTSGGDAPGPAGLAAWGARGEWGSSAEPRRGRNAFSSVWVGSGRQGRAEQGFLIDAGHAIRGADLGLLWSAWTRSGDPLGELGQTGEHGLEVRLRARAPGWQAAIAHEAHRAAIEDFEGFEREGRGSERTGGRAEWRAGETGVFAGLAGERDQERLDSSGPVIEPLAMRGRETEASAWLGVARDGRRLGLRVGWSRERLRRTLGAVTYDPADLEAWRGGAFFSGVVAGGELEASVDAEHASGETRALPRIAWSRPAGARGTIDARVAAAAAPSLVETGAADPSPGLERFVTRGWSAQIGARLGDPPLAPEAGDTGSVRASPGRPPRSPLSARLSLAAWTLRDVSFPGFGLLARDILESETVIADADGAAVLAAVEWWPARWATVGGSGYAAARETPAGVAVAAPDYRWTTWAGPRARLFHGSLDLLLVGELDAVGPRAAADEDFAAFVRPGARLVLGLGDAWVVIRGVDLDDARHPLPGRRPGGERLLSSGREIRASMEWRFRN